MYKLTNYPSIIRLSDKASFPINELSADYQEYLAWVAEGNTPEPADEPTPEPVKVELPKVDDVDRMTELSQLREVLKLLIERMGG